MVKMSIMQAGLLICLLLTGTIYYSSIYGTAPGVAQRVFAGEAYAESARASLQNSPLASPLAMAQSAEQEGAELEGDGAAAQSDVNAAQSAEEFQQQLPIYSGSRANQTSLVLIGAVLLALVVVGTLVIRRRD